MAACADTFLSICRLNDGIQFNKKNFTFLAFFTPRQPVLLHARFCRSRDNRGIGARSIFFFVHRHSHHPHPFPG
jgi:hypothetical protein